MRGTYYPNLDQVKDRISVLENTLIKVAYYAEITTISGQVSVPQNATVLLDQWGNGTDALVSKIVNGKPDFKDTGVDVNSFDGSGNYILSDNPPSNPSALIYYLSIPLKYLSGLDVDYIIDYMELKAELSMLLQWINFETTLNNPAYQEGRIFYDKNKKAISYYNEVSDITVNLGQEFLIRVFNNTGVTISNGAVVYPSGVDVPNNCVTVALADASKKDKSRLIFVATHDIPNNEIGYVTRFGEVGGINTVGKVGILYLSATTPGELVTTKPGGGNFVIIVGTSKIIGVNGSIVVDCAVTELTVEATDTNGFSNAQRMNTILAFNNSNRTFSISASSYPFYFYVNADKFEKYAQENIQITDVEGLHVFYYDSDILKTAANPSQADVDTLIRTKCIIAIIYWDAVNKIHTYFADERHGIGMTPTTHAYLHFLKGAQYLYGLELTDVLVDQNGTSNTHAQFGINAGSITDEDIMSIAPAIGPTVGLPVYYILGTNLLRRITNPGYSVITDVVAGIGTTGRLVYNQKVGSNYQLTVVGTGNFVLYHVVMINGLNGKDQQIVLMGQNTYTTINLARVGVSKEISEIANVFPISEIVYVASLIFETKDGFSNAVKAVIRSADTGVNYIDYISKKGVEGTTGTFDTADGKVVYVQNGVIKRIV